MRNLIVRSKSIFVTFGIIAAILPIMVWGAISPAGLSLIGKADAAVPLRIWFEPTVVAIGVNKKADVELWGLYDTKNMFVPKVQFEVVGEDGVRIVNDMVNYDKPFMGKVSFGKLSIEGLKLGSYEVKVIESSISTSLPNLPVETGSLTVIVK